MGAEKKVCCRNLWKICWPKKLQMATYIIGKAYDKKCLRQNIKKNCRTCRLVVAMASRVDVLFNLMLNLNKVLPQPCFFQWSSPFFSCQHICHMHKLTSQCHVSWCLIACTCHQINEKWYKSVYSSSWSKEFANWQNCHITSRQIDDSSPKSTHLYRLWGDLVLIFF